MFLFSADKVQLGACILQQPLPGRSVPLEGGVEVWFGHFQSLRLAWKPFLNVDATQRAFLMSGKVQDIMEEMLKSRVVLNQEEFGKKIALLKVFYYFELVISVAIFLTCFLSNSFSFIC